MISPPFELQSLPNIPLARLDEKLLAVAGQSVFVGISYSSVNTLALRPPRVVRAVSVPPKTTIVAVAALDDSAVCYATSERHRYFLKHINGSSCETQEECAALHYTDSCVVCVYRTTGLETFDCANLGRLNILDFAKTEVFVYSAMIAPLVCLVVTRTDSAFRFRTVALNKQEILSLKTTDVQLEGDEELGLFGFSGDTLFRCTPSTNFIYSYSVADVKLKSKFQIIGTPITSFVALPHANVAVAQDTIVSVIDCNFKSEIGRIQLAEPAQLLAYVDSEAMLVAVQGLKVVGLTLSFGKGTLLESIGRGIVEQESQWLLGFVDILEGAAASDVDLAEHAKRKIIAAQKMNLLILEDLEAAVKHSGKAFSRIISYLKDASLSWEAAVPPEVDTLIYEDSDRQVDPEFVRRIAELAFSVTGDGKLALQQGLPRGVAVYLLSHPLFPFHGSHLGNVFELLLAEPQLYDLAVATSPVANATDLLRALLSDQESVCASALNRLATEFGHSQIFEAAKELYATKSQAFNCSALIDRLSLMGDMSWVVISAFIDAGGLLGWDSQFLERLKLRLQETIEDIKEMSAARIAISGMLRSGDIDLEGENNTPAYANGEDIPAPKRSRRFHRLLKRQHVLPAYSIEKLTIK